MTWRRWASLLVCLGVAPRGRAGEPATVRIGSKAFTESVILAEIVAHLAENEGLEAEHVEGLGGTRLLWEALLAGQIDVYPEYTGTMVRRSSPARACAGWPRFARSSRNPGSG